VVPRKTASTRKLSPVWKRCGGRREHLRPDGAAGSSVWFKDYADRQDLSAWTLGGVLQMRHAKAPRPRALGARKVRLASRRASSGEVALAEIGDTELSTVGVGPGIYGWKKSLGFAP
jgi:hypothetical protein